MSRLLPPAELIQCEPRQAKRYSRDFILGVIVGAYAVVFLVASFTGGVVLVGGR